MVPSFASSGDAPADPPPLVNRRRMEADGGRAVALRPRVYSLVDAPDLLAAGVACRARPPRSDDGVVSCAAEAFASQAHSPALHPLSSCHA